MVHHWFGVETFGILKIRLLKAVLDPAKLLLECWKFVYFAVFHVRLNSDGSGAHLGDLRMGYQPETNKYSNN